MRQHGGTGTSSGVPTCLSTCSSCTETCCTARQVGIPARGGSSFDQTIVLDLLVLLLDQPVG